PAGQARPSAATAATSVARRPPPRGLVILSGFATALLIQGVLAATLSALIARSFGTEVSLLGLALSAAGLSGIIQALRWSWEPWLAGRFGAWSDGPRGPSDQAPKRPASQGSQDQRRAWMIPERPAALSARPSRLTSVPKLRAIRALRVAASTPWIRSAVAKPLRITRPRGGGRLATLVAAVAAEGRACPAG
ncbi:hypothetical protein, partial [Clostridioides difficile]|uniref:hypothetical protein n=1 Tax=Clostridioides difficile TaxID=1496 RepID=UPI002E8E296D